MKTAYLYLVLINCALIGMYDGHSNLSVSPAHRDNYADTEAVAAEPVRYKKPPKPLKVFDVYPNPANKIVYIRITGKQTVSLRNEEGRLIFKTAIREKATVNLSPLPAGVYFLTDEKTGATRQFTIVRQR